MNQPMTTWPPILFTGIGLQNFRNWIEVDGFDTVTFEPSCCLQSPLTRPSIENRLNSFRSFILGPTLSHRVWDAE